MDTMFKLRLAVAAALSLCAAIAQATCNAPATDSERAQCIGNDLRYSDSTINDIYGQLRTRLSPQGQSDLRHQEIAWIRIRAQTCQVDLKEYDGFE